MHRWRRESRPPWSPRSSPGALADAPFLGPTLAAELRRLAGAPAAGAAETFACTVSLASPAVVDGAVPAEAVAVDARGAATVLVLVPDGPGLGLAAVGIRAGRRGNRPDPARGRASAPT